MASDRMRLQELLAERAVVSRRAEVLSAVRGLDGSVEVGCTAGPGGRTRTDALFATLGPDWAARSVVMGDSLLLDRAAVLVHECLTALGGPLRIVLGSSLDMGPLVFSSAPSAAVLSALLAEDGEELWVFGKGRDALLMELMSSDVDDRASVFRISLHQPS